MYTNVYRHTWVSLFNYVHKSLCIIMYKDGYLYAKCCTSSVENSTFAVIYV